MNNDTQKGFNITLGAIYAVSVIYTAGSILSFIYGIFFSQIDPTDLNRSTRSGLHYYKDYGTGKEYIGNGDALIERLK